jgi:hypothetical protein
VQLPLLQAFPFPSTLGEVVLHLPSPAGVFIYSSHGKWVFPWGFPHTATFYKLSRSWLLGVCRHSCHLQPACCEYFPAPSLALRVPHPLCYVSFFVAVVVYSVCFFSLFPWVGVQGAMLIWPRVFCGSAMCHLAHLVVCIS